MADHLQGRVYVNLRISIQHIHRIVFRNLFEVNNVLEIPAYD